MVLNPLKSTYSPLTGWGLLKPITVSFLQSDSRAVGNCLYSFITFKAHTYLNNTDRILPLVCSGLEMMERETIELPRRFHRGEGEPSLLHYLHDTATHFSLACVALAVCIPFVFPSKPQIAEQSTASHIFQRASLKVTLKLSFSPCSSSPTRAI